MNEIVQEFLVESHENLDQLGRDLVALERDPSSRPLLASIFRTIHTIKGTSGFLAFGRLERVTHAGEGLLSRLRDGELVLDERMTDLLLRLVDAVRRMLSEIEASGADQPGDALSAADAVLIEALLSAQQTAVAETPSPTPALSPAQSAQPSRPAQASSPQPAELDEVVHEFLVESHENLDQLDRDLIRWERDPDSMELVSSVFRTIHTIKGTSSFLGFAELERLAHGGEGLLSDLRERRLRLDTAIATALLELVDHVRAILAAVEATGGETGTDPAVVDRVLARIGALRERSPADGRAGQLPDQREPKRIGERLIERGAVSNDDVTLAVLAQSAGDERPLGEILVGYGVATPDEVQEVIGRRSIVDGSVRVDVDLLDRLMRLVGELVTSRNQLAGTVLQAGDMAMLQSWQRLNTVTSELQEGVMKARMQPIDSIWNKLPRMVRDISQGLGRQVSLELHGAETELDRSVLDAVRDPLTHLVRNALDHGIEPVETRLAKGKPVEGKLTLRATARGGHVTLEISDDGAGIDHEQLGRLAVRRGVLSEAQVAAMSPTELRELIFLPGFSTADKVTNLSGRGVGMDVVKTNLTRIGGSVGVSSEKGAGTTIRITIPLTLAIIPALILQVAAERFALAQQAVLELVRVERRQRAELLQTVAGAAMLRLRGHLVPLVALHETLAVPGRVAPADGSTTIVLIGSDERCFGLIVDEVLDSEEIVVKPLPGQVAGLAVYSGATLLGDGRVSLILDPWAVAARAGLTSVAGTARRVADVEYRTDVDDSVLVVRLDAGRLLAIPMAGVTRLEEVPADRVERVGDREALQYDDRILPICRVSGLVGAAPDEAGGPADPLEVVVYTERGRSVGLVVREIVDIRDAALESLTDIDGPGVAGTAVVGERVMEMLDVREAILAADPHFYSELAAMTHPTHPAHPTHLAPARDTEEA